MFENHWSIFKDGNDELVEDLEYLRNTLKIRIRERTKSDHKKHIPDASSIFQPPDEELSLSSFIRAADRNATTSFLSALNDRVYEAGFMTE